MSTPPHFSLDLGVVCPFVGAYKQDQLGRVPTLRLGACVRKALKLLCFFQGKDGVQCIGSTAIYIFMVPKFVSCD